MSWEPSNVPVDLVRKLAAANEAYRKARAAEGQTRAAHKRDPLNRDKRARLEARKLVTAKTKAEYEDLRTVVHGMEGIVGADAGTGRVFRSAEVASAFVSPEIREAIIANFATPKGTKAESVYRPDEPKVSFVRDLISAQKMNTSARERLARNAKEVAHRLPELVENRSIDTAGFLAPAYFFEEYAHLARNKRPLADRATKAPVPEAGTQGYMPQFTSGSSATTFTQGGNAASVSPGTTNVTAYQAEVAGNVDVSRQLVDRLNIDLAVLTDLLEDYNYSLELTLYSGAGTAGTNLGLLNVSGAVNAATYTSGSPTQDAMVKKLQALKAAHMVALGKKPTSLFAHPNILAWLGEGYLSTFGTAPNVQYEQAGNYVGHPNFAGYVVGIPAFFDSAISIVAGAGTNQSYVFLTTDDEIYLAEDPLRTFRFQDVVSSTFAYRFQIVGRTFFYPHRRPEALSILSGTGTAVTP
jgi:hypothetical protein